MERKGGKGDDAWYFLICCWECQFAYESDKWNLMLIASMIKQGVLYQGIFCLTSVTLFSCFMLEQRIAVGLDPIPQS